jgi:tetratricopeptide (TPR) repeat protein
MVAAAVSAARSSGHANSLGFALKHAVLGAVLARRHVRAAALADECLQLASEHGLRMWGGYAEGLRGCVLLATGDPDDAMVATTRGLELLASTNHRLFTSLFLVTRARAFATLGQLDQATAALDSAVLMVEECSERWLWADLECAGGELARYRPAANGEQADPHAAEAHFGRALAIARAQQARSWELRASVSLARLWAERGERQRALDLLAPVYGWFTEGFATPDLVEAKALLDALG